MVAIHGLFVCLLVYYSKTYEWISTFGTLSILLRPQIFFKKFISTASILSLSRTLSVHTSQPYKRLGSIIPSYTPTFCLFRCMPLFPEVFQCSPSFLCFCYPMIDILTQSTITQYVHSEISVCFNFFQSPIILMDIHPIPLSILSYFHNLSFSLIHQQISPSTHSSKFLY